ncbi:MAG: carbohydrate ABC transporter substrate-binding protein, partial [Microvirga sp.]
MKTLTIAAATLAASLFCGAGAAQAQGKTITLCWAAWDPANALVELSKDFTAKSGVNMKF